MNIKNRNSEERVSNKSQIELSWKIHPHLPNIYCHRLSPKQIEGHYLDISDDQLELEISFIEGRINNKHPSLCCVYHFDAIQLPKQKIPTNQHFRLRVFTDRIIPFGSKDWNQLNILYALLGLKRLIMIYGPMKITERLFGKNEIGEVKMWISERPEKNKPDFPLFSEQQTVSSLRELISTKNRLCSSLLIGCKSMRECIQKMEKLTKLPKKHRNSPSIGLFLPDNHLRPGSGHFFQSLEKGKPKNFAEQPRNKCNSQHHLFTPLWNSNENWFKKNNKMKVCGDSKFPNRSTSFFSTLQEGKFMTTHRLDKKKTARNSGNYHQNNDSCKFFPTTPPSRFGTHQFKNFQKPSAYSHRAGQRTWRQPFPNKGYDITIINNNVSNYISHFPKNTFPEAEFSDRDNLREAKTPEFTWTGKHNSQSPSSKQVTRRKGVPSFIKDKGIHSQQPSYPNSNQGTRVVINSNQQKEKSPEEKDCDPYKRKQVKIFTFFKKDRDSQGQMEPNFSTPKAPGSTKNQGNNGIDDKKRIKSYYFPSSKNKTLFQKNKPVPPEKNQGGQLSSQASLPSDQDPKIEVKPLEEEKHVSSSLELRRLLKKEYQGLLGFNMDAIDEQTPQMAKFDSNRHSEDKKKSMIKENELKDKIKQKQEAFAELKKEALKVLTDF